MFKFDFSGEDINSDGDDVRSNEKSASSDLPQESSGEVKLLPVMYDISELLQNMPSRISYKMISTSPPAIPIPRREVFDIKMQIMADEDFTTESDSERDAFVKKELQILLSHTEDLRTELYEGGLKSWEGAGDLVEFLVDSNTSVADGVLELGCGSALPSIHLFQKHITSLPSEPRPVTFILSDYNYSVLRLMTAPNFLLAYYNSFNPTTDTAEFDVEVTESLISEFLTFLSDNLISVKFIAGSWSSREFANLLGYSEQRAIRLPYTTVLAAETIYSPASLNAFTSLLVDSACHWGCGPCTCVLVAAKEIYFGVGGTVRQFTEQLSDSGLSVSVARRITGRASGVARVVLRVS